MVLTGSALDHRLLPSQFEPRRGHSFIAFGGPSAHLAYHVHRSGHETSIIIIIAHYSHVLFSQDKYTVLDRSLGIMIQLDVTYNG